MTNLEIIKAHEEAWELHQRIVGLRNHAERTFIEIGEALYHFDANSYWRELGYGSFEEYIASPEVDLSRRVAYRLKGIYADFVLALNVPPEALLEAGNTKLDLVRSHANCENVEELVNMAATLSRTDLRQELSDRFEVPPLEWCICDKCGRKHVKQN